MSRRIKEETKLFSRQDIYDIRAFWDEKWKAGWTYAEIAAALAPLYTPASTQTLIRIGKRETWKEIGVGGAERSNMSNRLAGEARKTGDPVRMPPDYVPELTGDQIALRSASVVVPEVRLNADGTVHEVTAGEKGLEMLVRRAGPRGSWDEPPDLPPDGGDEPVEAILARNKEGGK